MDKPDLKFLDWKEPLVETAARELCKRGRGRLPVDFSQLHIVVPTAEAGRLLREKLAELCIGDGGAVNLRISMPEQLIRRPATATPSQTMLAWYDTLHEAGDAEFPELFRNHVLKNFRGTPEVLLGWGEMLQQCRADLAAEGLSISDVKDVFDSRCRTAPSESDETAFSRFDDFLKLETRYLQKLSELAPARPDPAAALLKAVKDPQLPEAVKTVVLIDCADLAGAPKKFLLNAGVAVECWVNAPEELAEHFDDFGCPDPGYWNKTPIDIDFKERLRIVPRPDQQAKKILALLRTAAAAGTLPSAVGVLDAEVASALETHAELAAGGAADRGKALKIFVPREIPLVELPWSQLLTAIVRLGGDETVAAMAKIWRSPLFSDYAGKVRKVDVETALQLLDELRGMHFVDDAVFLSRLLDECIRPADPKNPSPLRRKWGARLAPAAIDLQRLSRLGGKWRDSLTSAENPIEAAFDILSEIGSANCLEHIDFRLSESEVRALTRVVAEIAETAPELTMLPLLLRHRLAATKVRLREAPSDAVDAVGFMELPWRSDRTVLIAGFNDENLSAGCADDPFLPDAERKKLGMMTCEKRRAADALRLKALNSSRDRRVYLLCGDRSQSGGNLFPSRLLLQCGRDDLPARADELFGKRLVEEPPPPTAASPLLLPRGAAPTHMSITGFKTYLECPFSFYLERVLGFKSHDPEPPELDALAYGNLAHAVLEHCPRKAPAPLPAPDGKDRSKWLREDISAELKARIGKDFGDAPPALVKLQCEMVGNSLEYFSEAQCREFAAGWEILDTEVPVRGVVWSEIYNAAVPGAEPEPWRDDVKLSGQIDRIDRLKHTDGTFELRVLDYKTTAGAKSPRETHFQSGVPAWGEKERFAMFRTVKNRTVACYWKDLQLPLYVLLLRHKLQTEYDSAHAAKISAGYFMLPLELTRTGVSIFEELEIPEVLESAVRCADATLRRIFDEGIFLPRCKKTLDPFPGCSIAITAFGDPPQKSEVQS